MFLMTNIDSIRKKIAKGQFEFTKHAVDQSILRRITVQEVREAVASGRINEDYPADKYGPSCLIMGFTFNQRVCTSIAATQHGL